MSTKLNILIIDTDQSSCEEMQEFLQREGFFVLPTNSASEGRVVIKNTRIDILIVDINMPGTNGIELVTEFKDHYKKLDVIVISGFGSIDSIIQLMRLGILDFLRKPLRQKDLLFAVNSSHKIKKRTNKNFLLPDNEPSRSFRISDFPN